MLNDIHRLSVFIFILIPSSFLVTYCIAVSLKHVEIGFPYISDTGTYVPESCIFSQALNFVSFSLALFMYVQYKHIEQHYRDNLSSQHAIVLRLNKWALVVGLLGCLGINVIANYQETSVIVVHMSGAIAAFSCATFYCWTQTIISHYVCPLLNSLFVARLRVFLSLLVTVSYAITIVAGSIAHNNFHGKDATKWYPGDGGFTEHVISSGAEWILVISFDFFILTYVKELQNIAISSPQIHFISEDLKLQNTETFYNSEDHLSIATSQNSLRVNSRSNVPRSESLRENVLTTQAVVH